MWRTTRIRSRVDPDHRLWRPASSLPAPPSSSYASLHRAGWQRSRGGCLVSSARRGELWRAQRSAGAATGTGPSGSAPSRFGSALISGLVIGNDETGPTAENYRNSARLEARDGVGRWRGTSGLVGPAANSWRFRRRGSARHRESLARFQHPLPTPGVRFSLTGRSPGQSATRIPPCQGVGAWSKRSGTS